MMTLRQDLLQNSLPGFLFSALCVRGPKQKPDEALISNIIEKKLPPLSATLKDSCRARLYLRHLYTR